MKNMTNYLKQIDASWLASSVYFTQPTVFSLFLVLIFIVALQFLKRHHDKETIDQLLNHPKGKEIEFFYSNRKELKIKFKDEIKPEKDYS